MKILVVDDVPDNIELAAQTLEDFDYDVIAAENGHEAIDKAFSDLPDLILLDVMMPDMDGFEVCKKLGERDETKDIPIIMLTAKTQAEDLKKGFDSGAHDYIKKPFEEIELMSRVQSALKLKQSRDQLKKRNADLFSITQQLKASNNLLYTEIEERKVLEKELRIKNEYSASLIRDSPVATISTDLNEKIVTANTSSKKLLGLEENELLGEPISKILGSQMEISNIDDLNIEITKKDGTRVPVNVSTAILSEMGQEKGLVITLKDISEIKGLKITPVEEEDEIEEKMRFTLEKGICYILDSDDYSKGFEIFIDHVRHKKHGLCVSRQNPLKIRSKFGIEKTPIIWLTKSDSINEKCISPEDLTKLDSTIKNFVKEADDGIVIFEGLEYLSIHNNFNSVIKFTNSLTDALAQASSRLLVLIDSKAFESKDFHILKKDFECIKLLPKEE